MGGVLCTIGTSELTLHPVPLTVVGFFCTIGTSEVALHPVPLTMGGVLCAVGMSNLTLPSPLTMGGDVYATFTAEVTLHPNPHHLALDFILCKFTLNMFLCRTGGEDRSTSFNIVERYNPKSETWCFVPSMHQKRAGAGITVCDGKIYVAGEGSCTLND